MNDNEILNLINIKELEIKKLQLEVDSLKKQLKELRTNVTENALNREDKVRIFMN